MKEKTVLIAVYGTLRKDEGNHRFAANAISNRPCTLKGTLYDTGYGFPAFVQEGDSQVAGELIEVTLADWAGIDRLEGYPRLYDRKLINVTLEDGTTVKAWAYIMNEMPVQAKVINSGDWKVR